MTKQLENLQYTFKKQTNMDYNPLQFMIKLITEKEVHFNVNEKEKFKESKPITLFRTIYKVKNSNTNILLYNFIIIYIKLIMKSLLF